MPDTTTWYKYFEYNSNGKGTKSIEKWVNSATSYYRTNLFTYSSDGIDLLVWTNANNAPTLKQNFNGYHQPLNVTNALGEVTSYTYESAGSTRMLTKTTPAGLLSTYGYGGSGLSTIVDSISGSPVRTNGFTWSNGDLRTQTDPRGMTRTITVDGLHRTARIDFPDSSYIQYGYTNGAGTKILDLSYVKDRIGNQTYYAYDSLRRKIQEKDGRGNSTFFGYCPCGATEYVTNNLSQVTHYTLDRQGNNTITDYPDGTHRTNSFDLLRRLVLVGDGQGFTTNAFDNLSRLVKISDAGGQKVLNTFDAEDRVTTLTDGNGVQVTQSFDDLNRIRVAGLIVP